jgi:serine/threonine-protein kinase RsbW
VKLTIPSDYDAGRDVQERILEQVKLHGFGTDATFAIRIALEEALVNAIKHGNQLDPAKTVTVSYVLNPEKFEVRITDQGPGFNPDDVPDPTAPENLERPCGRGLLLIRYYMTDVSFHDAGRTIAMFKARSGAK